VEKRAVVTKITVYGELRPPVKRTIPNPQKKLTKGKYIWNEYSDNIPIPRGETGE
jgi:hypothetical protein